MAYNPERAKELTEIIKARSQARAKAGASALFRSDDYLSPGWRPPTEREAALDPDGVLMDLALSAVPVGKVASTANASGKVGKAAKWLFTAPEGQKNYNLWYWGGKGVKETGRFIKQHSDEIKSGVKRVGKVIGKAGAVLDVPQVAARALISPRIPVPRALSATLGSAAIAGGIYWGMQDKNKRIENANPDNAPSTPIQNPPLENRQAAVREDVLTRGVNDYIKTGKVDKLREAVQRLKGDSPELRQLFADHQIYQRAYQDEYKGFSYDEVLSNLDTYVDPIMRQRAQDKIDTFHRKYAFENVEAWAPYLKKDQEGE
jgi:hypothetical protein